MSIERARTRGIGSFFVLGLAAATLLLSGGQAETAYAASEAASNPESNVDGEASQARLEFVGENLFSTANGRFHTWRVLESVIDLESVERSEATIEVDLTSVDTGNSRRDDHLRDPDFFETETYPTATVRGHSLVGSGESEAGNPLYVAQFDIDLHGVQKTLSGEVELMSASPVIFEGRLVVDRLDFGVGPKPSRWNPMSIEVEIPVRFRIEL